MTYYQLWLVRVQWTKDNSSPWIGPIVGDTRSRKLMTLMRKRLRENKTPFVRVEREILRSPMWMMGWDCMQDSVDRMLSDVFDSHRDYLAQELGI